MKAVPLVTLNNYRLFRRLDLKKDEKLTLRLKLAALIVLIPFGILYLILFLTDRTAFFLDIDEAGVSLTRAILPLIFCLPVYVVALFSHELIHGAFFRLFSPGRIRYGFSGIFAYAGNPGMAYSKREYTVCMLAPAVILTAVFAVLCAFTRSGWFFILYWNMAIHSGGCAGDIYAVWFLRKLPGETVIEDNGLCMSIYVPKENES